MSPPDQSSPQRAAQDVKDCATGPGLGLLRNTPLRTWEWLLPPLILAVIAAAGITHLGQVAAESGLAILGWASLPLASLFLAVAGALAWFGHRAYARVTPAASWAFARVKVMGVSGLAVATILVGIVGASWPVIVTGTCSIVALWAVIRNSPPYEWAPSTDSLARTTGRALFAAGTVLTVAPIVAALGALLGADPSSDVAARYLADSLVFPVIGLILMAHAHTKSRSDQKAGRDLDDQTRE